jgi:hypothetical protein
MLAFVVSTLVLLLLVKQIKLLSRQLDDATRQAASENARQRKQATIEFIAATFDKLHEFYNSIPAPGSPKQVEFAGRAMERDTLEYLTLRDYLHYLEDLCVGVNMGILDREAIDRSMGARIQAAWRLYEHWILCERDHLQRIVYDELEACAKDLAALDHADPRPSYIRYYQPGEHAT